MSDNAMAELSFSFSASLWKYSGEGAAWYFVTLPKDRAERIKFLQGGRRRGWGAVRVEVMMGDTRWKTSIFPDSSSGSYLLPVKAAVRKAEKISEGNVGIFNIEVFI